MHILDEEEYEQLQRKIRKILNQNSKLNDRETKDLETMAEQSIVYEEMNFEVESMRSPNFKWT